MENVHVMTETPPAQFYMLVVSRKYDLGKTELSAFFPFAQVMPCGEIVTIRTVDDIPTEDTKCPCGDPNHWVVKWVD